MRDKPTNKDIQVFLKTISDVAVFVVSYEGTDHVTVIDGEGRVFAAPGYPGAYIEWERSAFAGTPQDGSDTLLPVSGMAVWNNGKVLVSWASWGSVSEGIETTDFLLHIPQVLKDLVLDGAGYGQKNRQLTRALWRSQQDREG